MQLLYLVSNFADFQGHAIRAIFQMQIDIELGTNHLYSGRPISICFLQKINGNFNASIGNTYIVI